MLGNVVKVDSLACASQRNGFDCGVFVFYFTLFIIEAYVRLGGAARFRSDMRWRGDLRRAVETEVSALRVLLRSRFQESARCYVSQMSGSTCKPVSTSLAARTAKSGAAPAKGAAPCAPSGQSGRSSTKTVVAAAKASASVASAAASSSKSVAGAAAGVLVVLKKQQDRKHCQLCGEVGHRIDGCPLRVQPLAKEGGCLGGPGDARVCVFLHE